MSDTTALRDLLERDAKPRPGIRAAVNDGILAAWLREHGATVMEWQRDSERYRWLRANPNFLGWEHDFAAEGVDREVDAAIDAATSTEGR